MSARVTQSADRHKGQHLNTAAATVHHHRRSPVTEADITFIKVRSDCQCDCVCRSSRRIPGAASLLRQQRLNFTQLFFHRPLRSNSKGRAERIDRIAHSLSQPPFCMESRERFLSHFHLSLYSCSLLWLRCSVSVAHTDTDAG